MGLKLHKLLQQQVEKEFQRQHYYYEKLPASQMVLRRNKLMGFERSFVVYCQVLGLVVQEEEMGVEKFH